MFFTSAVSYNLQIVGGDVTKYIGLFLKVAVTSQWQGGNFRDTYKMFYIIMKIKKLLK